MYSVALLAFLPAILAKPYPRQATTAADGTLYIHPNGNTNFCLGTYGAYNSAPVDIFDCSTKTAATPSWSLDSSRRRFQLNGTNFCLDAGSNSEHLFTYLPLHPLTHTQSVTVSP